MSTSITLSPVQFRAAEQLFHELADADRTTQEKRLKLQAAEDVAVADEVLRMLKREREAESGGAGVEGVEGLAARVAAVRKESAEVPEQIGRYRLGRMLGEGGMGQVFEATQEEPLRRTVALKLIRGGLSNAAAIARFEAEQQALAVMDHPNIARVLDADIHEDGRPYFVMELVRGVSITHYCDQHRLGIKDRIHLFLAVLDAVQHAHQKGVIHRDLKPSNILVAESPAASSEAKTAGLQDPATESEEQTPSRGAGSKGYSNKGRSSRDVGTVKVIDFGIAKAIEEPLLAESQATRVGDLVGTPEYMSPEQASLGAIDVDVRSDIYSLGLVLYELLTGGLPISRRELRAAGFDEMRRMIREQEATRPSEKVATALQGSARSVTLPAPPVGEAGEAGDGTDSAAAQRGLEVDALARRLRGDLDWVLLKALGKDRKRRYQSAVEFAADLHRHLNDEPVSAGPPTLRYRAQKFARRNRAGVLAAALLAAAVTAGLIGTTYGLLSARSSGREAEAQRQTAERTVRFMGDLFKAADPRERAGRDITVNEVLDRGAESIDALEDEHATQLRLLALFGDIYRAQGRYDESEALLRRVMGFDPPPGSLDVEQLHRQRLLAAARLGGLLRNRGELAAAETVLREQLASNEGAIGPTDQAVGGAYNNLGTVLRQQGRYDEARAAYQRALDAATVNENPPHAGVATVLNNLGSIALYLGEEERAADLIQQSITIFETFLPEGHPNFMVLNQNLGVLQRRMGRQHAALEASAKAITVGRLALGNEHPSLADALQNQGWIQLNLGDLVGAEASFREGLEILENSVGGDTVPATRIRGPLARCLWLQGRVAEAEEQFRLALLSADKMSVADQGGTLNYQRDLATLLRWQGRTQEAIDLTDDLLLSTQQLGSSVVGAESQQGLAWLQRALQQEGRGLSADALVSFERALEAAGCTEVTSCSLDSPESLITRASFYAQRGEVDRALAALEFYFQRDESRVSAMDDADLEPLFGNVQFEAIRERWRTTVLER